MEGSLVVESAYIYPVILFLTASLLILSFQCSKQAVEYHYSKGAGLYKTRMIEHNLNEDHSINSVIVQSDPEQKESKIWYHTEEILLVKYVLHNQQSNHEEQGENDG